MFVCFDFTVYDFYLFQVIFKFSEFSKLRFSEAASPNENKQKLKNTSIFILFV